MPIVSRNKHYKPAIADWTISIIPSRNSKKGDLFSCWKEVIALADRAGDEGAHILAYHFRESDYPTFAHELHDRHRLIWLQRDVIRSYGGDPFTKLIESLAHFETQWRTKLRPQGTDSATLLPESSFAPVQLGNMWRRVREVTLNHDNVDRVFSIVRYFRESHYHRGVWQDYRNLEFEAAHEQHRQAEISQRWKFTYLAPPSFHYNVKSRFDGKAFTITDWHGVTRAFRRYTNVDCHGLIWGGH